MDWIAAKSQAARGIVTVSTRVIFGLPRLLPHFLVQVWFDPQ
jgi:hypothetical protein